MGWGTSRPRVAGSEWRLRLLARLGLADMTNTKTLAALMFPGQLDVYVAGCRRDGDSWRTIATKVNENFGGKMSVSYETLREWFGDAA